MPFCARVQVHFHAPNLVVATGQNSVPWEPQLPGRSQFRGTVMHSFDYKNPAPFKVRLAASFTARYMVQGVSFCAASARERRQCQLVRPHDSTGKRTTHVIKAACRLLSRNTQSAGQTTWCANPVSSLPRCLPPQGKKVLVVGFGNSAGEIALDLSEKGAHPTVLIRCDKVRACIHQQGSCKGWKSSQQGCSRWP